MPRKLALAAFALTLITLSAPLSAQAGGGRNNFGRGRGVAVVGVGGGYGGVAVVQQRVAVVRAAPVVVVQRVRPGLRARVRASVRGFRNGF